jgi:hypothetical protein
MSLLYVSATHGPSSGNTYYLGRPLHCTLCPSTLRHVVVVVDDDDDDDDDDVVVNSLHRIFSSYLS